MVFYRDTSCLLFSTSSHATVKAEWISRIQGSIRRFRIMMPHLSVCIHSGTSRYVSFLSNAEESPVWGRVQLAEHMLQILLLCTFYELRDALSFWKDEPTVERSIVHQLYWRFKKYGVKGLMAAYFWSFAAGESHPSLVGHVVERLLLDCFRHALLHPQNASYRIRKEALLPLTMCTSRVPHRKDETKKQQQNRRFKEWAILPPAAFYATENADYLLIRKDYLKFFALVEWVE